MGTNALTVIGVRHHSPACARLVEATIDAIRPAYVLVEGPADMNHRLDELLLGHELPVAVFTSYRDAERTHASWSPLCAYSPEWVALTRGRAAGADARFIDLPAWHPAFARRQNRYADAEDRYDRAIRRLCAEFGMDNTDTLWDHLVESAPAAGLAARLEAYFDALRGDADTGPDDAERETYMAAWIQAALARGDGPVLAVCGGFHRPALLRLAAGPAGPGWPEVPRPPDDAVGSSYLVPYSFTRLDAFAGYQSGMPSPEFYQRVWEDGPTGAARGLIETVVGRLRERRQPVSTADLIAARTMADGLARMRGHTVPARADVLDGLVSALVGEALEVPLPWAHRGVLAAGTHPVVVEMVAALAGDRVGRLHPDTPLPPLVADAIAELAGYALDNPGDRRVDLTDPRDRECSRVLHRLRVLGIPGVHRRSGPKPGADPQLTEVWELTGDDRLVALIEAGAYGATLAEAAAARLTERAATAAGQADRLAGVLFDAALCGVTELVEQVSDRLRGSVAIIADLGELGGLLAAALGLWRHDRLFGTARSPVLAAVVAAGVRRGLWLAEGVRGGPAAANPRRLLAVAALRDAARHAADATDVDDAIVRGVMGRIAADPTAPPDLRGAAFGAGWSLGDTRDAPRAVRGVRAPDVLGDWLAGLFCVARAEATADEGLMAVLDDLVAAMTDGEFLIALPSLRQAFAYFPPRERAGLAEAVLARRGVQASGHRLLRLDTDPVAVARARELDAYVDGLLVREGLVAAP